MVAGARYLKKKKGFDGSWIIQQGAQVFVLWEIYGMQIRVQSSHLYQVTNPFLMAIEASGHIIDRNKRSDPNTPDIYKSSYERKTVVSCSLTHLSYNSFAFKWWNGFECDVSHEKGAIRLMNTA